MSIRPYPDARDAVPGLPASLHVERMREEDLDEVMVIERRIYEFPWTRANFSDSIAGGHSVWVARSASGVEGYCIIMAVVDEVHLLNLSVAPLAQGKGVGRALLHWTETVARRLDAASVLLEVRPSNLRALGLYERTGYERVGVRRGYYPATRGREDAIVMRKPLHRPEQR
jgi:ribosomal-protein-alanine N-acetyltransferase